MFDVAVLHDRRFDFELGVSCVVDVGVGVTLCWRLCGD